jgi:hypothetical protein
MAYFIKFRLEAPVIFILQKLITTMEELSKLSIACTPDIVTGVTGGTVMALLGWMTKVLEVDY